MWGKLSSNASAAFSVVQDAYAGVAKDLMNTGIGQGGEDTAARTSELRGRDVLSAWGQERSPSPLPPSSTSYQRAPVTENPWSISPTSQQHISIFDENPWGIPSEAESESTAPPRPSAIEPMSPLPLDPTVVPIPLTSAALVVTPSALGRNAPQAMARSRAKSPPNEPKNDNTDPLGVGLL